MTYGIPFLVLLLILILALDVLIRMTIKIAPRLVPEWLRSRYGCFCHHCEPYGWVIFGSCPFHDRD